MLAALSGCSSEPSCNVSGTVTFDGKSVPLGSITFTPDRQKGGTGPQIMAQVLNGNIILDRVVSAGPIRMSVTCFDGVAYDAGGEKILTGKPLCPTQSTQIDLPSGSADLAVNVQKSNGSSYKLDVDF